MKIQESAENYLEAILILKQNKGSVRSIDIAHYLNFSKPSVSIAMKNLRNSDMITVDSDGFISLTEAGHKIADTIFERHTVLSNMLIKLGVPAEIAAEDACRMEHIVSDDSIMCLNSFLRNDGRYQRAITGYNPHSRYAVGTYPGIMGIYQISEETCPRRLAEEFYDYKRDILLNVELGKSHFVLQKKEENEAVRKFCRSLKKENGQLTSSVVWSRGVICLP